MAEARHLPPDRYLAYSAGIVAHGPNPLAVQVMQEAGVNISAQQSQTIADLASVEPSVVITVCSHADEKCPVLPGNTRKMHVPFDDPPALARECKSEEEALKHYRRVRDEIRDFVTRMTEELGDV